MGYSWLITTRCNYFCCQHVGANLGGEAVGGGYHDPVLGFLFVFVHVVLPQLLHGSLVRCQSTSSHGARCFFAQCNPVPAVLEYHLAI